ncbi:MAG: type III-A CRISPR-associated RAMP protein Csm4 [Tissierellia bacterium]|nr:type III-A CRISPR-associated RAMP protein Csm4 [Tissierellia bacterium]
MKYTIFKLFFKKGLRIGNIHLDSNQIEISADILFSAIVNEAASMGEEKCAEILELFMKDRLIISDAFPSIKDELFLPKPLISNFEDSGDSNEKKAFKKLKFIPLSKWEEFINGKSNPDELNQLFSNFGTSELNTKIKHSISGEHDIYNISYFRFQANSGLYFLLGYELDSDYEKFEELLHDLSFTGIGGKKSSGWGSFVFIEIDTPKELLNRLNTPNSNMLLTTSMAKESELKFIFEKDCSYRVSRRGGFIYTENKNAINDNTKRKQTMHFFKSGSIFDKRFEGDIFEIGKGFSHSVYRYGKPMWLEV